MKKLQPRIFVSFTMILFAGMTFAESTEIDLNSLTWLAGTRYIAKEDGSKSYETWTGPSGNRVSGSVAAAINGGFVEFFWIGPNEQGVFGLHTSNSGVGLNNWTFLPIKSLQPGRIVFGLADGSRDFSIESVANGAIHNVSTRIVDGKTVKQEWLWLALTNKG